MVASNKDNNPFEIQRGALATDQDTIDSAYMATLQYLADPKTFQPQLAYEVLNNLAQFLPLAQEKIATLQAENIEQILKDPTRITRLQQIFQELAQTKNVQQQMEQLRKLKQNAQQQAREQQVQDTDNLKTYVDRMKGQGLSTQKQAIMQDAVDTVTKTHEAKRDKGVFGDPLGVFGILFEIWLQLNFIVPVDEKYFSKGFKYNTSTDNLYLDQLRKETGGNDLVFPNAVAPRVGR